MVDYLIYEPSFSDSPSRCYKLPFVVCQALSVDNEHMQSILFGHGNPQHSKVLNKLFSFISQPLKGKELNATLGGYFNKVLSFWLIKRPDQVKIINYA